MEEEFFMMLIQLQLQQLLQEHSSSQSQNNKNINNMLVTKRPPKQDKNAVISLFLNQSPESPTQWQEVLTSYNIHTQPPEYRLSLNLHHIRHHTFRVLFSNVVINFIKLHKEKKRNSSTICIHSSIFLFFPSFYQFHVSRNENRWKEETASIVVKFDGWKNWKGAWEPFFFHFRKRKKRGKLIWKLK